MENQKQKTFKKTRLNMFFGLFFLVFFWTLAFIMWYFLWGKETELWVKIKNNEIIKNVEKSMQSTFSVSIPKVYSANFDLWYKKIPSWTKQVEFNLWVIIDEKTVDEENFIISPEKKWKLKVEGNKIKYIFEESLKKGEKISFFLSKNIKAVNWKNLDKEYNFLVTVVSKAKVTRIFPNSKITNLNKPILVFFSLPIVNLTDLDSRDKLPCPLEIEPKIEWKCKWLTTSILEFTPKNRFIEATNYKIKITDKKGLLYNLEEKKEITLETPKIEFFTNFSFNPKNWIIISSNFPVVFESLKEKISLSPESFLPDREKGAAKKMKKLEKINIKIEKISNSKFKILLKNDDFEYHKNYSILIKSWVEPKNWSIKTQKDFSKIIKSEKFIRDISVNREIFSSSGTLVDIETYLEKNSIPTKNIFLNLELREKIILDNSSFSFESENWKKVEILVLNENEKNNKEKDNKEKDNEEKEKNEIFKYKIKILEKLENNKKYIFKVNKKVNKNFKKDLQEIFYSSKKLKINEIKILNYKKICFYINNKVSQSWKKKNDFLDFSPKAKISYVWSGKDYPNYKLQKQYNFKKIPDDVLYKNWYCKEAKKWEKLYIIHSKLNPETNYEISVSKNLKDIYWNNFDWNKKISFKTGKIQDIDKEFYFLTNNSVNTIPKKAKIFFGLQVTNLDKINLEVRELSVLDFLKNNYWKEAKNYKTKSSFELKLKNKYWNFTKNTFDLEKDVLGKSLTTNIVQIWAKLGKKKEFTTYIKSNLSLVLESATNKKILFITDFEWKKVDNLNLKFYRIIYTENWKFLEVKAFSPVETISFKETLSPESSLPDGEKGAAKKEENKKNWVYEFEKLDTKNLVIVAENKKLGYFWILDYRLNSTSNYDFKYISWVSSSQKNFLYLYTERPIYKPWDTVYFKWILRKFWFKWYSKTDISEANLEILDPKWKIIKTLELKDFKNSNFSWKFIIPKWVPTGKFSFNFITSKKTIKNNAHFFIEEYRKPVFKVVIKEPPMPSPQPSPLGGEGVKGKNNFILWEKFDFIVSWEYYFGWKLKNTSGEYSVLAQNYFFDSKDFSDYKFGEWYEYFNCLYWGSCNYNDNLIDSKKFKISEKWEKKLEYIFPKKDENGEKIYTFSVLMKDPDTSRVVRKSFSKILHITDAYVGLITNYYFKKWEKINWGIIVLNHKAKILKNKNVKVELIKTTWKNVKKKGIDGNFYYEYEQEKKLEQKQNIISNKKWIAKFEFSPKSNWEYLVKVSYIWKNKKEFISSKNIFVESENYISWRNSNNSITKLEAEKIKVNIWDEANFILKSPINKGKAIIFIEKDDGILDYFIHDLKTYSDTIKIKVKSEYYPNFYTKVFLIWKEKDKLLPIYKRALASTKVDTKFKKLNIKITANKNSYLPWEKVKMKIEVKDNSGLWVANTDLSVWIVDQSLLALKGNPKKNPYVFFYDLKRYLWVKTFLSLTNLVEKLEVIDAKDWEKWWGWEEVMWWNTTKKRWTFKDTAFWLANLKTDEKWVAFMESEKLPDNLTTWVIEVVWNTSDTKVWVAYETILTTKKLQINDNLPNFFGSNDEVILSPVIFNRTGKKRKFKVSLNWINFNIKVWEAEKIIEIEKNSSKTINFKIKINDIWISGNKNFFSSRINIKVENSSKTLSPESSLPDREKGATKKEEKFVDEIEKFIRIKETSTKENISTTGKTKEKSFKEIINLSNLKNKNWTLQINYSKTIFWQLTTWIDYLNNFPYGCSEQQTSAIMPNIFIKKLYNSAQIDFDFKTKMVKRWQWEKNWYVEISLQNIIENYLVNIRKFQKRDWGFVYFYDVNWKNYSDFYLSSYMLESLSKIRDIWFEVDEAMLQNLSKYLKNRFYKNYNESCENYYNYKKDCEYSISSRLKALSAILTYDNDDYEVYKMYKILKEPSKIPLSNFPPKGERIASKNKIEIKPDEKIFYNKLDKAIFLGKLIKNKNLTSSQLIPSIKSKKKEDIKISEKEKLKNKAVELINEVIDKKLSLSARWAFIEGNNRTLDTAKFLKWVSMIWLDEFKNIEKIIDLTNAWLIKQKREDWSFGSTEQTIKIIEAISEYLINSKELEEVDDYVKILLNSKIIDEKKFDEKNKLEVVNIKTFSPEYPSPQPSPLQGEGEATRKKYEGIKLLNWENEFFINKTGSGNIYYDLNLWYYLDTKDLKSRDEGFFVERIFYKYEDYEKIEKLQKTEQKKYKDKQISYEDLKYPKDIINYLNSVEKGKIGELLIVYNKIINSETRDKILFEWFIPSGAVLINPNLETNEKKSISLWKDNLPKKSPLSQPFPPREKGVATEIKIGELIFDKKEFRLDRFFWYKEFLRPWIHNFTYLIRLTHSWNYNIKPTKVSEFYNVENFGRTAWEIFVVE